jgi:hypothetical protein
LLRGDVRNEGENLLKVPLFKGDARGISTDSNEANKV